MCGDLTVDTAALFRRKDMMFFPLPFPLNTINNILEMHNIVVTPWVRRTEQKRFK
jgi:hypothetical protein